MAIYTRRGDDGTTGLHLGGRVRKDSLVVEAYGTVDEAQAFLGMARVGAEPGSELDRLLVGLERDLWVLMAELATPDENRHKLRAGTTLVTEEMVKTLEGHIDNLTARLDLPTEFVVPGQTRPGALLDVARTVVRRAERLAVGAAAGGSWALAYLNRLSDLLWTMARWQESQWLPARSGES